MERAGAGAAKEVTVDIPESVSVIPRSDPQRASWLFNTQIGFAVLAAQNLCVLVYFLLTPNGPHHTALEATVLVMAFVALGAIPASFWVAAQGWRIWFSFAMTVLSGLVVALCAHFDAGIHSPLLYLTVLPVAGAALSLPGGYVAASGIALAVEVGVVAWTDPRVTRADSGGVVLGAVLVGVVILTSVSARSRARLQSQNDTLLAQIEELAITDPLTGCLNQRVFRARLTAEVHRSRRYGDPLSLLILDLDGFKSYNDTHGHAAGDAVLIRMGRLLRQAVRATDVVARIGGDEFAVILPSTLLGEGLDEGAVQVAERVTSAVGAAIGLGVNVTIGAATLDLGDATAERLFSDAEAALERARHGDRGRIAIRRPD